MPTTGLDSYVVDDYWFCDYCDPCLLPGGGSGRRKPFDPPGRDKPKPQKGARKVSERPGDFVVGSTAEFDAAVKEQEPPPPPKLVVLDLEAVPELALDPLAAALAGADAALARSHAVTAQLAQQQQQQLAAAASAQRAQWQENAKIIAIVNAALAS